MRRRIDDPELVREQCADEANLQARIARELTFRAENGEETLRRHFSTVEREDVVAVATVHDRETLVNNQQSMDRGRSTRA